MKRRDFLTTSGIGSISVILAGSLLPSCLPLKHLTGAIPSDLKTRTDLAEETALWFAYTVIPTEAVVRQGVIDPLWDADLGFSDYCPLFLDLLQTTSKDLYGLPFTRISHRQREQLLQHLLDGGGVGSQLIQGAILAVQCAFYAGIDDEENGCPTIGFRGSAGIGQGLPPLDPAELLQPVAQTIH